MADVLFNRIDVDGYFLEYDTARAGSFEPLRLVPKGKRVVLGLVSSKKASLESESDLIRKIETASKYLPLDQLALSPQCGFASSVKGNPLGAGRAGSQAQAHRRSGRQDMGNSMKKGKPEQKLDIFPHIFPREFFERMKEIAARNPSLAAALKRWMHIPVLWDLERRIKMMKKWPGYQQVLTLVHAGH